MTLTIKALSLNMAKKMAEAAEKAALEHNINIAIAILDAHGNLKYFLRMDNNSFISVRMSQLKALSSASFPVSTKSLADRNKGLDNGPYLAVPGVVLFEGGLPIITQDGQHIGAIGISGANPELDGICAQAGLNAIKEDL